MAATPRMLVSEFVEQRVEVASFVLPHKPRVHVDCQLQTREVGDINDSEAHGSAKHSTQQIAA